MNLVTNERTKLLASLLNSVAVAALVAGLIAPSTSMLYGLANPAAGHWWLFIA
jgi:ABC-type multidrug transport system permease subunit